MRLVAVLWEELQLPDDAARDEVVLDVRVLAPRRGPDEAPDLEVVRGGNARPRKEPHGSGGQGPPWLAEHVLRERPEPGQRCRIGVQRSMFRQVLDVELQVVLQVLAHIWKVMQRLNAVRLQLLSVANTAQHQQLGGTHSPRGKNNLALRQELVRVAILVGCFHSDHTVPIEEKAVREAASGDGDLGGGTAVRQQWPKVGLCRAGADAAIVDGHVHLPEALLLIAVLVFGVGVACLHPGLDEGVVDRSNCGGALPAHCQRAVESAIWRRRIGVKVTLRLPKVGQHMLVAPVLAADLFSPPLVVQSVAPDVCHRIET
mmetsp:Transcript_64560/g.185632  ORF Transcript_64560/g.185632 Transcript_64560/m.185632 type:complete len:316 (-) Transcript_64560:360-1307(-)